MSTALQAHPRRQWQFSPVTRRWHIVTGQTDPVGFNADPLPTPVPAEQEVSFSAALKRITPALIIVGIATGAAFAIGSGLVSRYVFKEGHNR